LTELADFLVRARVLIAELVAREAEDGDVVMVVVERTQTCVLRGEASTTRDVDHQAELAGEPVERHLVARDRGHLELVEG
jgi:hypothetical protein